MKVGSLCSGYEGIGLGLELVFGDVEHSWFVEYDAAPSKILAHHWPTVPNYGDVKHTDWAAVEPVDLLTAGYPCQPFSHAGLRKGADDPRHLWPGVEGAISVLRPRLVLLENVRGHVSLGLDAVLGDLAALGYDATWGVVRASDAGSPHSRARIFILATDTQGEPWGIGHGDDVRAGSGALGRGQNTGRGAAADACDAASDGQRSRPEPGQRGATAPDARRLGWDEGRTAGSGEADRGGTSAHVAGRSNAPASDAAGEGLEGRGAERGGSVTALPTDRGSAAADPDGSGREARDGRPGAGDARRLQPVVAGAAPGDVQWGAYAPAIARWEAVTGRAAPRPTEPGRTGERLSPRFVEWMMGLPAGHVTDVPGLARNAQLKALGNGVVPQQAALAVRTLLPLAVAA